MGAWARSAQSLTNSLCGRSSCRHRDRCQAAAPVLSLIVLCERSAQSESTPPFAHVPFRLDRLRLPPSSARKRCAPRLRKPRGSHVSCGRALRERRGTSIKLIVIAGVATALFSRLRGTVGALGFSISAGLVVWRRSMLLCSPARSARSLAVWRTCFAHVTPLR